MISNICPFRRISTTLSTLTATAMSNQPTPTPTPTPTPNANLNLNLNLNLKPESIFIHLHTNDLRLHDSPTLSLAHSTAKHDVTHFLPIYVFDERYLSLACVPGFGSLGPLKHGEDRLDSSAMSTATAIATDVKAIPGPRSRNGAFHRTGRHRARFLIETVMDLKKRYKAKGSDLIIACGRPEDVVAEIVGKMNVDVEERDGSRLVEGVYMQKEVTTEEVNIIRRLRCNLQKFNVPVNVVDSRTLISPQDLPFKISSVPNLYTTFRKEVESLGKGMIRPSLSDVTNIKPLPRIPEIEGYILPSELGTTDAFLPYILAPLLAQPPLGDPVEVRPIPGSAEEWRSFIQDLAIVDPRSAFPFHGGESTGLDRLDDYLGTTTGGVTGKGQGGEKAMSYKVTRNGMLGEGFSTKFSAWLANGSLSARYIGNRVWQLEDRLCEEKALTSQIQGNTYWIIFELLWRDYFFFISERFSHVAPFKGRRSTLSQYAGQEGGTSSPLFNLGGFQQVLNPNESKKTINLWKPYDLTKVDDKARLFFEGRTGVPFLDACLRELASSGYMSNRGRQNVASFFTMDLYIDWRPAAEWFETMLLDHDVCSNWGNWLYQAGVGNDARASRSFNPIKQANQYDPSGEFTRTWLPELSQVPDNLLQTPWLLPQSDKHRYIGDYPHHPLVEQQAWKKHYRHDRKHMDVTENFKGNSAGAGGGDSRSNGTNESKNRNGGRDQGRGRGNGRARKEQDAQN